MIPSNSTENEKENNMGECQDPHGTQDIPTH